MQKSSPTDFTGARKLDASAMAPEGGTPGAPSDPMLMLSLLTAVRASLVRVLGMPAIPIVSSNAQAGKYKERRDLQYPRAFLRFPNWEPMMRLNNMTISRRGYTNVITSGDQTRRLNARVYPIQVTGELHYLVDDAKLATTMLSHMITLIQAKAFGIRVVVQEAFDYQSMILFNGGVPMEESDFSSEEKKAVNELVFSFTVDGWAGIIDRTVIHQKTRVEAKPVLSTMQRALEEIRQQHKNGEL